MCKKDNDKKVIVTNQQFSEKYYELKLNNLTKFKRVDQETVLDISKTVLREFGVKVLSAPHDAERFKLWQSEVKRLKLSFNRYLQAIQKRKNLNAAFFNSSRFTELAKLEPRSSNVNTKVIEF